MSETDTELENRERRLDEAAAKYLQLQAAGQLIDRSWFLGQYSDLADELAEFLDDLDQFNGTVVPADQSESENQSKLFLESDGGPITTNTSVRQRLRALAPSTRYRLNHLIARGGMGEVWCAEDAHVGRQIAVKRILDAANTDTIAEERFLFESQIMGQLEHPCIVPLHDLGRDGSGKLFAVMKLVNGCSLKERLSVFHATKSGADWPRQVDFMRLLEAFASICRAMAYAHSRGVLHRDIKPENIMLGSYGEALLLDWGLAKALDSVERTADRNVATEKVRLTPGVSTTTRAGAIMGSPAYMPPEIATGHADVADERTDVYLLGATLYEVLTGKPPRSGSSQREIITLAQSSPPAPPRRIDPQIPRALEAICLRAMAHLSAQRYESASAFATEIENYLAGEPVTAYREPALARCWRWCRRHRRIIQRTLIGVTLAVLCGLIWFSYRRAIELETRETARVKLAAFRRLSDEAQFYAANTDTVSEHAPYFDPQRAIQLGNAALESAAGWGDQASLFPIADERPALTAELYDLLLVLANLQQQSTTTADQQIDALKWLDRAARLRPASRAYHQIRARCLRQSGQTVEANRESELAANESHLTAQDWFLEGELERSASAHSARLGSVLSNDQQDTVAVQRAIEAYQQGLRLDPEHYWAQFQLARCYLRTQRGPESVASLGTCIALRPESPWAYSTRGLVQGLLGQFEAAETDLAEALRLAPQFRPARLNRGFVYFLQNRDSAALSELDEVLQPPLESVLIEAAFYRAQILYQRSDLSDALLDCGRFIIERPGFAPAHTLAAQIHFRQGDDAKGIECVDAAIACSPPTAMQLQSSEASFDRGRVLRQLAMGLDLASQQRVLRLALREFESIDGQSNDAEVTAIKDLLGQSTEAIQAYSERLAKAPTDMETRMLRGWNYVKLRKFDLAQADFDVAVQQMMDDGEAHAGLGYVLAMKGDRMAAELEATKAIMYGADGFLVLHNVACIYAELADSQQQLQKHYEDLAITMLQRAVSLARQTTSGVNEIEVIRQEEAFHESLKMRAEFRQLLGLAPKP